MEKEEKKRRSRGIRIFPTIRPILEEGEAIIILDESEKKEEKGKIIYKRVVILNTGDEIKVNDQAGYVSLWFHLLQRIIGVIPYICAIFLGMVYVAIRLL